MTHELPKLPFHTEKMSPFCSSETFEYHYGKHHAAYVNKLNAAIANTAYQDLPLDEAIKKAYQDSNMAVYNNAAQHFNHSFFWQCLTDKEDKKVFKGKVKEVIVDTYGSFENFQNEFNDKAATLFGSGWTWLVLNEHKKPEILQTKNADTPLTKNFTPLLTLDVWEHAYYIDFRNSRLEYIENFWNFINWKFVNKQL